MGKSDLRKKSKSEKDKKNNKAKKAPTIKRSNEEVRIEKETTVDPIIDNRYFEGNEEEAGTEQSASKDEELNAGTDVTDTKKDPSQSGKEVRRDGQDEDNIEDNTKDGDDIKDNIKDGTSEEFQDTPYTKHKDSITKYCHEIRTDSDRYQSYEERRKLKSVQVEMEVLVAGMKRSSWKGVFMMKDCREIMVYQMMIQDIKPRTVIELGTYQGGFTVWLADQLFVHNIHGHVFTMDTNPDLISDITRTYPTITCIEGDASKIEKAFPGKLLTKQPHPWLIIDDCRANTAVVLRYFGRKMKRGDYIVVEEKQAEAYIFGEELRDKAQEKVVQSFLQEHKDEFKVDSYYSDYFGINAINRNGYITRVKRRPKHTESVRFPERDIWQHAEVHRQNRKSKATGKSFRMTFNEEDG